MTELEINREYIKKLAEKYGNEAVYEVINERSYSYGYYGRDMESPGPTSTFNGAKGAWKSIPSFLICALVSPPLAGLMLLGALFHRINQKWHDHDSRFAALNPFTWAEYLATGNYIPKGMDKPFWTAGSNADPNSIKTAQGDSSTIAGTAATAQKEIYENVPPEDAEKLIFNYRWLVFDNGEIRKVMCYTDQQAGAYAKIFLNPQKNKGARLNYENLNKLLKARNTTCAYICEYDDGQIIYTVAEDEKTARSNADDVIVKTANILKKERNDFEVPTLKYVTKTEWDKIQPMRTCTNILLYQPAHKDYVPNYRDTDENKYFWEFDNFKQYTLKTVGGLGGLLSFNIPAVLSPTNKQAVEIAKTIFDKTNKIMQAYIISIAHAKQTSTWYSAKAKDGDRYIIPEDDIKKVYEIAGLMHNMKMDALRTIMSNEEITKVIEYMQKNGLAVSDKQKLYRVTPMKSAEDDEKRHVKEIDFSKNTDVNGHLNIQRVKSMEQKFTVPFLEGGKPTA